ncbi:hypothetical protein HAX54_051542 [Datura stramonium]|uniref:Uncharacterized protein n=1 Tax=Datura stramonium TaxID=4076 RepID=A0ABS8RRZ8_DATST|nr:hypothetical protein [Datura stramonium]
MDASDQKPNQEENKEEEVPAAGDGESPDLLKSELESLEKMVVEELSSDETKAAIDKTNTTIESLAQGFAESAKGLASKVETWSSSVLHNQTPNVSEEATDSLPTSDKHVGESSAADTDSANNHEQAPTNTEKQSLVGVTSWMNCCGLLEVLARPSDK